MTRQMPVPSLSLVVAAAAMARATNGSCVCQYSLGRLGPPGQGLRRLFGMCVCSGRKSDSNPRCSASRASSPTWMAYSVANMCSPTCMTISFRATSVARTGGLGQDARPFHTTMPVPDRQAMAGM